MYTCEKCGCDMGLSLYWTEDNDGVYRCMCNICILSSRIENLENIIHELYDWLKVQFDFKEVK